MTRLLPVAALACLLPMACSEAPSPVPPPRDVASAAPDAFGFTAPSAHTIEANRRAAAALPLDDPGDFELATTGRIAHEDRVRVTAADGRVIWDTGTYDFVEGEAPGSVHPSLWRQEKLNNEHGLFQVADGIWQVRGYDLANMSIIQGETGWILVDPLGNEETARHALDFAREHLGDQPIRAILFTHSHIDHFGGVKGVVSTEQLDAGTIRVVAPEGFVEESVSENILAGTAMGRRAAFMYGFGLPRSPRGHVGSGLGKEPGTGNFSIAVPTDTIDATGEELVIDGVRFIFQHTPGSEAPSEFMFYLPGKKALFGAEVVSRNMHNVLTLRGAKVRDAAAWSGYIDETVRLFPEAEVLVNSHHWPVLGREEIRDFLEGQRDTYKFLHDQTLRLANSGHTPREIAEELDLPPSLAGSFANRGYYGTTSHNSRAVYQRYFGFYDGNPANLNPLPPAEEASRFVAAMGGAENVLAEGQRAFDAGDYRWGARVLNHMVFADPGNAQARALLAATYDQLGYQSESGPWRDAYLTAALELRTGKPSATVDISDAGDILGRIPISGFLDAMAVRIVADKVDGDDLVFNFVFTDLDETYVVEISNSALKHRRAEPDPDADATVRMTRDFWLKLVTGEAGASDLLLSDEFEIEGSRMAFLSVLAGLDAGDGNFAIVTP